MPKDLLNQEPVDLLDERLKFPAKFQNTSSAPVINMGVTDSFVNTARQNIGLGGTPPPQEAKPTGFSASFKAGFVRDPQTKMRIFAEELFPNQPNAIDRFGIVDNEVVFIDDSGRLVKASSGGMADLGKSTSNLPEMAGATIGSLVTGNPATGSVVGDVGGRAVKQAIGSTVFDEPQTAQDNLLDLGKEGVLASTGALLGTSATSLLNRRAVKDFTRFDLDNAVNVQKRIKSSTGIDLDVAQASQLAGVKQLRKWAFKFPSEAAEVMENFAKLQQGQSIEAVEGILNALSKKTNLQELGQSGVNAAKASIDLAKKHRADRTGNFFKASFQENVKVDANPVVELIESLSAQAKGSRRAALAKARSLLNKSGAKQLDDSVQGLHNSKLAIDAMLEKKGSTAISNQSRRDLTEIKNILVDQLKGASANYRQGNEMFAEISEKIINPLIDSPVGILAEVKNRQAANAAATLFSKTPNPRAVRLAKRVIKSQNPQAWRDLTRLRLQQELEKSMQVTQSGQIVNMQGKFFQSVAGSRSRQAALQEALDDDVIQAAGDVLEAFEFIANSPIGGSDTAFNQLVTEQQRLGATTLIGKAATPLRSIADAADQAFLERHSVAIAEALTDPKKLVQVQKLLQLPKNQERQIKLVSTILTSRTGQEVTRTGRSSEDRSPSILRR